MSGQIPQHFIDELIATIDIVELIDSFIPLKKTGNAYTCCCPFHQEKTPSFNVIPHKQFFYCFGCGANGNSIKFVMQFSHLDFPAAIQYLANIAGLLMPQATPHLQQQSLGTLHELLEQIKKIYQNNLQNPIESISEYIKKRHLSPEVISLFQLGYAPPDWNFLSDKFPKQNKELIETGMLISQEKGRPYDRFRHRLMFPLHNRKGKLIGFAGRIIDDNQKPKYLNSPETSLFHKQKELYGLYQVLQQQEHPPFIIVVEGYLDVISLFQYGLPQAVATMGTATSNHHLHTLNKYTDDIIFCFDGDAAGLQAARRALDTCIPLCNQLASIRFLFLPQEHDPDSYIRHFGLHQFQEALQQTQTLAQYFATQLYQQYGKQGPQKLIQESQKKLLELESGPGKDLIIEELTKVTRLDPYRIRQLLHQKPHYTHPQTLTSTPLAPGLRLALALLLQHPKLYAMLPKTISQNTSYPETLQQVLHILTQDSQLSGANIIERFRDSPDYNILSELILMDHQIHPEKYLPTLIETLNHLIKQQLTQEIDVLLKKLREHGLSAEEKNQLQNLLKIKHKEKTTNKQTQ